MKTPTLTPPSPKSSASKTTLWEAVGSRLPWLVIAFAFGWSLFKVSVTQHKDAPAPGEKVIRLGHYQLEPTAKVAFEEIAKDFEKIHPGVKIVQEIIPSAAYGQWLSTQLISGKPMDILQAGGGLPPAVQLAYAARYYAPLTKYVRAPNPYNKGTELENVPWVDTYWDAMRWSFSPELQEFTSIPLSQLGQRIAVNLDLLKKLTGLDQPPTDYRKFLEVCEKIRAQKDADGRSYIAIANSRYHSGAWEGNMANYLTWPLIMISDINRNGFVDTNELYLGYKAGMFSMLDPSIATRFQVNREIAAQSQTGFTGLDRPEAVFTFIQQRSVFMACGSYEAAGLFDQSKGLFRMQIVDFPRIARNDPVYGRYTWGNPIEISGSLFQFSVVRNSPHADLAIDFLRYLGSKKTNEKFNKIIGWLPAIDGAEVLEMLKPFKPHVEGMYGASDLFLGGETTVRWNQLQALYQIGQISYEEMMKQYGEFYRGEPGLRDFEEQHRNWRRALPTKERGLIGLASFALRAEPEKQPYLFAKYAVERSSTIREEIDRSMQLNLLDHPEKYRGEFSGAYSPEALEAVRQRREAKAVSPTSTLTP